MNQERLLKIILAPITSEKSTRIANKYRQFVFKILPSATKLEVKKAIELLFKVAVKSVRICNIKGKSKSFRGQVAGRRSGLKKAYVTLQEGCDISFSSAENN
jgi:large subunit ribosomal protein L23